MSDDWKGDFKRAMIDAVVTHGSKVREGASPGYGNFSGWQDWGDTDWVSAESKAKTQIKAEGIDYDKSIYQDSEWYEFAGTFADEPWARERGVDVTIVTLAGNTFVLRYESSIGALITAVLEP